MREKPNMLTGIIIALINITLFIAIVVVLSMASRTLCEEIEHRGIKNIALKIWEGSEDQ